MAFKLFGFLFGHHTCLCEVELTSLALPADLAKPVFDEDNNKLFHECPQPADILTDTGVICPFGFQVYSMSNHMCSLM